MLEKAIVIGGSMAGKLAAKALSDFFKEVIILEAGEEWNEKSPRKRVPQSHHPHVLLKGGEVAIEKLFPSIMTQLKEDGGIVNNFTGELRWHHFGVWKQPFTGELNAVQQSRPMLEWHIQKRMSQVNNITTKYETMVEQLLIDTHRNKISGVKTKCLITGMKKDLQADLVVDTSGFSSKNIEWLGTQGIEVKEEKVWIQLFYATRVFRLKKNKRPDWCNLLISPSFPENPYGAFIQTIEDNQYFVTFSGYANEKAPKTDEEFFAFAHKLLAPDFIHFLEQAEPITDIKVHRIPYQVRRRFDIVKNMPEGFLVIGDAHCRFDPVFGQGISVAAMEAEELQMCLKKGKALEKGFTRGFYKRISKIIKTPWEMATTEAFRHPKIKGEKSFIQPFQQWYTKKIYQLSANNPDIYIRLVRVMNLMRSPLHLFHPKVWFAILTTRQK
ncbi:glutamate synthase [Bacillus cereus]|uniref:glutamate synthase n=1 Tax=Bacillus cereus TaxID=1396 RepID=UPI001145EE81